MKTRIFSFLTMIILLLIVHSINGQGIVGLYTGHSNSSFEKQVESSGSFLFGLQAMYSLKTPSIINLNFGLEFNYLAPSFSFDIKDQSGSKLVTRNQKQLFIGALVKVLLANRFILDPYLRLGAGLYSGGHTLEFSESIKQEAQQKQVSLPDELDISSSFGFNLGFGVKYKLPSMLNSALFIEFVYNIVSREIDESPLNLLAAARDSFNKNTQGANSWAILAGYQLGI